MLVPRSLLLNWVFIQLSVLLLLQQAFSPWIITIYGILLLGRLYTAWFGKSAVNLRMVNLLAAAIAVMLLINLRQAGVLHFMLQILLLSAISRLWAMHHSADARQLVWVHYFLIACGFIMHQDMLVALFVFVLLFLNLYCHYRLFAPSSAIVRHRSLTPGVLLLLPIWLGLFFLFPRLPPFWHIPQANTARTGLSDTLDPGSIEQLAQSDELAFRSSFAGSPPPRQQLYWRAMVYEQFDGRSWKVHPERERIANNRPPSVAIEPNLIENPFSYQVIAEASHQQSLFALGQPLTVKGDVGIADSGLIRSNKPVSQRLSYQVNSVLQPITLISDVEAQVNLHIATGNPQTIKLAEKLRAQFNDAGRIAAALAEHFRQQPFYYSLTPPLLGRNSIDQFMFETRTGFCGHYASATAFILRAAGFPARVVGGYQGGVWHPEQGYLAVRQREAHAWVEYLNNGQWHMFDPTAAVAPERILQNLEEVLSPQQRLLLESGWRQIGWLQTLRQQLLHLDYYWSVWVLGFDHTSQRQLWQQLKQQAVLIAYLAAVITGLVLLATTLVLLRRRTARLANTPKASQLIERYFKKLPVAKTPHQSISAYLNYLAQLAPEHASWLMQLSHCYEQAVFANDAQATARLHQLLRQHKPALNRLRLSIKNAQRRL